MAKQVVYDDDARYALLRGAISWPDQAVEACMQRNADETHM